MLRTILVMRHAKARDGDSAPRDFDRNLTKSGRHTAQETGECLRSMGIKVDRIIASSSVRTRQTAEIVAAKACPASPIDLLDSLYNATAAMFASSIGEKSAPDESAVLVVGHNPGIAGLMCHWAEESLAVPPATLTVFQLETDDWTKIRLAESCSPRLVAVIQGGKILRQDDSFGNSALSESDSK